MVREKHIASVGLLRAVFLLGWHTMRNASETALAADQQFSRIRLRLTGKLTPLRTESRVGAAEDESELRVLLEAAVARAESAHAALPDDATWRSVVVLLPLLTQAQALLLSSERSRCHAVEQRRGRASHVRFACYDLSAVEPPKPAADGPSVPNDAVLQETLLQVLAQLVCQQHTILQAATANDRDRVLEPLVEALRVEAAEQRNARSRRTAGWYADAFEALRRDGALPPAPSTMQQALRTRVLLLRCRTDMRRRSCDDAS